jgi:hypothetical protein
MPELDIPKKRAPDRNRATATVSVPWHVYDRLEDLAGDHSIATTISALIDFYGKQNAVKKPRKPRTKN